MAGDDRNDPKYSNDGKKLEYEGDDQGPTGEREMTDVAFLVLFIAFNVGMLIVAIYGGINGQPTRLTNGVDMYGQVCGVDNSANNGSWKNLESRPFLYFPDPDERQIQLCVEDCPNRTVAIPKSVDDFICDYGGGQEAPANLGEALLRSDCWKVYRTKELFNRCLPVVVGSDSDSANATAKNKAARSAKSQEISQKLFADMLRAKWVIFTCCFLAVILGFVWLLLLRVAAGIMVWATILLFLAALFYITYQVKQNMDEAKDELDAIPPEQRTDDDDDNYKSLRGLFIFFVVCSVVAVIVVVFMRNRINLAVEIIKEASKAVTAMPLIVFFPILIFFVLLAFSVYWFVVAMYLATAGEPSYDENGQFDGYEADKTLRRMQSYHFFGLLWITQFWLGVLQMTVAGAVSTWYFTRDKQNDLPDHPVIASFHRTMRYHAGSIALGSLIIAIVQYIRVMIKEMEEGLKTGPENKVVKFLLCCLDCCFACVERFLKFISRNAYIQTSIYGYSFCTAARVAFQLIYRNALRVATVNAISEFLLFLGKLFITLIVGIIALNWLRDLKDPELNYYFMPLMLIIILAYWIASAFMSLYDMTIDTILLCFLEDEERNDGDEHPYYASEDLQEHINKNHERAKLKVGDGSKGKDSHDQPAAAAAGDGGTSEMSEAQPAAQQQEAQPAQSGGGQM